MDADKFDCICVNLCSSVVNDLTKIEALVANLPDVEGARRFFSQLQEKHSSEARKLFREQNQGLLSDVLALAAWSSFLATTILQHPDYISWLSRQRRETQIRTQEDLLEALARFSLTNSQLEPHVLLARFRRRELLRIYLRDIRGLATTAEITEELSNLADAILQFALNIARQELENRYGLPLEIDEKGRALTAQFCVVALGKLGSKELNYASDIDLLFLYSGDGATSGTGTRGATSNKEFFVKLSEQVSKIVGQAAGEGAAYRVDLRLRPHGRVGALAISVKEAVPYYQKTARDWERQVLLRSRSSAGEAEVFKRFLAAVEDSVFQPDVSVADALESVRQSKLKINQELDSAGGFNVKLGRGGIREIEFIAQALQLAHGGRDEWLRVPHTLISLARLADRKIISDSELTALADAYTFLRTLEHRLQMEQGLQTHTVPNDEAKRSLVAARMNRSSLADFNESLQFHTENVSAVFERVFNPTNLFETQRRKDAEEKDTNENIKKDFSNVSPRLSGSALKDTVHISDTVAEQQTVLERFCEVSSYFGEILTANPKLIEALSAEENLERNYSENLTASISNAESFAEELANLRAAWARFYVEIAALDAFGKIPMREANRLQTELAEASMQAAFLIVEKELSRRFGKNQPSAVSRQLSALGLGRFGSRGMDYGSDLDLVLIYDDEQPAPSEGLTHAEYYARAAETLVTALSSLTKDGYLYRVDLRLRPDGKNGATASGAKAFLHYLEHRSAIWEWLAYVKLRAVGGEPDFVRTVERRAREIIHANAKKTDAAALKTETVKIRHALEKQKAKNLRRGEIDIKHGAGGLLDIYFVVRYLQLRDAVFDEDANRTTSFTLRRLQEVGSLDAENFEILRGGYEFLRELDHALRLIAGRSTKLPTAGNPTLEKIAARLNFASATELHSQIALHTANIRTSFENLMS
jgi:[glutamine synthetase] adenylyltransferase / [glutamine synthetase]-adenylyl-L-tyrosine phosphorylase